MQTKAVMDSLYHLRQLIGANQYEAFDTYAARGVGAKSGTGSGGRSGKGRVSPPASGANSDQVTKAEDRHVDFHFKLFLKEKYVRNFIERQILSKVFWRMKMAFHRSVTTIRDRLPERVVYTRYEPRWPITETHPQRPVLGGSPLSAKYTVSEKVSSAVKRVTDRYRPPGSQSSKTEVRLESSSPLKSKSPMGESPARGFSEISPDADLSDSSGDELLRYTEEILRRRRELGAKEAPMPVNPPILPVRPLRVPEAKKATPTSDSPPKRFARGFRVSPLPIIESENSKSPTADIGVNTSKQESSDTSDDLEIMHPLTVPKVLQDRLSARPFADLSDSDLAVSPKNGKASIPPNNLNLKTPSPVNTSTRTQASPISSLPSEMMKRDVAQRKFDAGDVLDFDLPPVSQRAKYKSDTPFRKDSSSSSSTDETNDSHHNLFESSGSKKKKKLESPEKFDKVKKKEMVKKEEGSDSEMDTDMLLRKMKRMFPELNLDSTLGEV
jgi:hypothetical protein